MKKFLLALIGFGLVLTSCDSSEDDTEDSGPGVVKGCMDPLSVSYNPDAVEDNGDCEYLTSSNPEPRNAVIEVFTGVRCKSCPASMDIAETIKKSSPDRVFIIGAHGGSDAAPEIGWPDLGISFTAGVIGKSAISTFPAGNVNRTFFNGPKYEVQKGGMAMSSNGWSTAVSDVLQMSAPVNLGVAATYAEETGIIKIHIEGQYTAEETENNHLNIAILENGIVGRQYEGGKDNPNYVHNNVLRDVITGQWGKKLDQYEVGKRWVLAYEYELPVSYKHPTGMKASYEDIEIVTFISRGQTDVLAVAGTSVSKE